MNSSAYRGVRPARRRRSFFFGALLSVPLLTVVPTGIAGQNPEARIVAGPSLPLDHWVSGALRRADALGLIPDYLPSHRTISADAALEALVAALVDAPAAEGEIVAQLVQWRDRLRAEFPGVATAPGRGGAGGVGILGARAGVGGIYRRGFALPGTGEFEPDRAGALAVENERAPWVDLDVSVGLGDRVGFRAAPRAMGDDLKVDVLEVYAALGVARITVGRSQSGYGPGMGGSVTLSGVAALDVVQLETRRAVRVPGVQRLTGPLSIHVFGGRMREWRHPDRPYVWGGSVQFRPHRRATFGVHRAGFFGGDDSEDSITPGRILDMLIGRVAGMGFEDQIVSASGKFALPTEEVLPLELYVEWGSEDAAGAWFDVPGFVIGLWSPLLPFGPEWSAGTEIGHFAGPCCDNPKWYRHWSFPGAWASREDPLGHPIGGEGTEVNARLRFESDSWARIDGRLFTRVRGEDNLYVPGRFGRSWGAGVELERVVAERGRLRLRLSREEGDGWAETLLLVKGEVIR